MAWSTYHFGKSKNDAKRSAPSCGSRTLMRLSHVDTVLRDEMGNAMAGVAACDVMRAFYLLGRGEVLPEPKKQPLCEVAEFCVFDTETNGLGSDAVAIQTAVGFFDASGKALGFYDKLWKLPRGSHVSRSSHDVHHISEKRLNEEGLETQHELKKVHRIFKTMKRRRKQIVAHNGAFDSRILLQTARMHGYIGWDIVTNDVFCTMQRSKHRCGLKTKTGRIKSPSNSELYNVLTGKRPQGPLHDACFDVKVTAASYVQGRRRGWW